jgi:hypothetical protein
MLPTTPTGHEPSHLCRKNHAVGPPLPSAPSRLGRPRREPRAAHEVYPACTRWDHCHVPRHDSMQWLRHHAQRQSSWGSGRLKVLKEEEKKGNEHHRRKIIAKKEKN